MSLDTYEKYLAGILLIFGMAIAAYFVYSLVRSMNAPVSVKWVYGTDGRFEGVVVA
jgi:hypothetical protein